MSDGPAPPTKVCLQCGKDVAGAPRVKDAKGNYYCRECAAKKRDELSKLLSDSAINVPMDSPDEDLAIMSNLLDDSVAKSASSCPSCRRPWKEGAVVCTGCGFNRQTGQIMGTQIRRPDADKDRKGHR